VGPAPEWIRTRIEAVGIRSINNIVDIANYVMLELGEPLHTFDAEKLQGGIQVRLAEAGEQFDALDGRTYSLGKENLVIADQKRAVAIAGVMGGENTGVTGDTRHLVLESAYFLPASVRRTARTLNLPSDASYRFERGVDPGIILRASERATELIQQYAGGKAATEILTGGALPEPPSPVVLDYQRCRELLGVEIESEEVDRILTGFGLTKREDGSWKIPGHRRDLRRDVDLMEEVVRVHGIERIPSEDRSRFTPRSAADRAYDFEARIRARLVACGISEARTSALIPREALTAISDTVELRNPLSEDHVALRPSLTRGLLDVLVRNQHMGAATVRLFELGRIFRPPRAEEERALGLLFCGAAESRPHWRETTRRHLDFFDLKSAIEVIGVPDLGFRRAHHPEYALAAEITAANRVIGLAGQLNVARAEALGTKAPILVAEIGLEVLLQSDRPARQFAELEKFPSVTRDIAMIVPETLSHGEILRTIETVQEPFLERVELFDLFSGEQAENIGAGRKSLAYTLTYRARNRTLKAEEVSAMHARIRERLQRELGAELRE
jgi:phenylalanyl-tRNA synthetase beta chain